MNNPLPEDTIKTSTEKRILNEFAAKILNEEKMSRVLQERGKNNHISNLSEMLFHCECDDKACGKLISISTEEYEHVHRKTKQFIVASGHVQLDLEAVIEQFKGYTLVEKFFPHEKAA